MSNPEGTHFNSSGFIQKSMLFHFNSTGMSWKVLRVLPETAPRGHRNCIVDSSARHQVVMSIALLVMKYTGSGHELSGGDSWEM
jgi:hypothetical protein